MNNPSADGATLRQILQSAGVHGPLLSDRSRLTLIVASAILFLALYVATNLNLLNSKWLDAFGPILAALAFVAGYLQWRAARHEISFDKYYDKLAVANQSFDTWRREMLRDQPAALQDHLYTMFVFSELDNFEYILEKYKLGYVREEFMERALRDLIARCEEENLYRNAHTDLFRDRAQILLNAAKGYEDTTRRILAEVRRHIETQPPSRP